MRRRRFAVALLTGIALALGATTAATPATPPGPTGPASPVGHAGVGSPGGTEVTLVTGDTVVMAGGAVVDIRPGPGRSRVGFGTFRLDEELHVIPADAGPLVASGAVDARLFNVTRQLEWGYDDAELDELPLLAERAPTSRATAPPEARLTDSFDRTGIDALGLDKAGAADFWNALTGSAATSGAPATLGAGVRTLWLDGRVEALLDRSVPQIGAPTAWDAGLTGAGVTVAVLDSGYDVDHPDLRDRVRLAKGFTSIGEDDVGDAVGHGTHVASTVGGSGAASDGRYTGVAPDADLIVGKVLDDHGRGDESWILAGMEWAAAEQDATIVNLSLGGRDFPGEDPLERAINRLTTQTDTLFVVAAGNTGADGGRTIGSPGSADAALTVGAVDADDTLADFSSRGPRIGDYAVKPDVTAPGVGITAAIPIWQGSDPYGQSSGTSMAAPHVSGAAALLAQRHPDLSAAELAGALIGSAEPAAGPDDGQSPLQQGAGRVDVARAVTADTHATPGNLSTHLRWPHDGPVRRTVTYRNTGDVDLTLRLSASDPAFVPDTDTVLVPAGGTADSQVTIDPEATGPGVFAGILTATPDSGDGEPIRTVLGAYVEPEAYRADIEVVGHNGEGVDALLLVHSRTDDRYEWVWADAGRADLRLPAGGYNIAGFVETPGSWETTLVNVPFDLDGGDRRVVVDTRGSVQPTMTLDDPDAEPTDFVQIGVTYDRGDAQYSLGAGRLRSSAYVLPVDQPGLTWLQYQPWRKAASQPEQGSQPGQGSPFVYHVVDVRDGGIPADPSYPASVDELARVDVTYRAAGPSGYDSSTMGLELPDGTRTGGLSNRLTTPATIAEYVTPDPRLRWWREVQTGGLLHETAGSVRYRPGEHEEVWNAAVLGPSLPDSCAWVADDLFAGPCAVREDDTIWWFGHLNLLVDAGGVLPGRQRRGLGGLSGTVTLSRDGTVLGTGDLTEPFAVPVQDAPGRYTLEVAGDRFGSNPTFSTRVEAEYSFESASVDGREPLPLMAIRYAPLGLDDQNAAPAARPVPVGLRVEGYGPAALERLSVEASFDDGETWQPVPVVGSGANRQALVTSPEPAFVSLRATAVDAAGNRTVQTVLRAYRTVEGGDGP